MPTVSLYLLARLGLRFQQLAQKGIEFAFFHFHLEHMLSY